MGFFVSRHAEGSNKILYLNQQTGGKMPKTLLPQLLLKNSEDFHKSIMPSLYIYYHNIMIANKLAQYYVREEKISTT